MLEGAQYGKKLQMDTNMMHFVFDLAQPDNLEVFINDSFPKFTTIFPASRTSESKAEGLRG